ncbi:MAG: DUF4291 domain-containing protein [Chthoniobacteraceae bacterium]
MDTRLYSEQLSQWPKSGRHILAQFDADSIHVYQAYNPRIAKHTTDNQCFGGDFSYSRMSWIKPNFLWMMYRSGWASKEGQERILAIRLKRSFFDELLKLVVPSTFDSSRFKSYKDWQDAVTSSDVRLQWDPDHDPQGRPLERRAVQLGIRGVTLRRYGEQELLGIEDITGFVVEQRENLQNSFDKLCLPEERIYHPADQEAIIAAGIEHL